MQPNNTYTLPLLLLLFLSAIGTAHAQFNTLTQKVAPEKEYQKFRVVENVPTVTNAEKKGSGVWWRKLFRGEKAALRREVDSLKSLLAKPQPPTPTPNTLKQLQDSIILSLAKKAVLESYNTKTQTATVTQSAHIAHTALPLKGDLQITSHFGERFHPILKQERMHNGIDLRAYYQPVYAVLDGVISGVGWDAKGGGIYIKVKHQNFETTYCHLSEVYYNVGEAVKAGYAIGKSGNTGLSTAPHLHFSVKQYNQYINPVAFLNDLITLNR